RPAQELVEALDGAGAGQARGAERGEQLAAARGGRGPEGVAQGLGLAQPRGGARGAARHQRRSSWLTSARPASTSTRAARSMSSTWKAMTAAMLGDTTA